MTRNEYMWSTKLQHDDRLQRMKPDRLRKRLAALPPAPLIRQVEVVLDDIEAALARRTGLVAICEALQESGLQISVNTLKRCLYRLRRERQAREEGGSA